MGYMSWVFRVSWVFSHHVLYGFIDQEIIGFKLYKCLRLSYFQRFQRFRDFMFEIVILSEISEIHRFRDSILLSKKPKTFSLLKVFRLSLGPKGSLFYSIYKSVYVGHAVV